MITSLSLRRAAVRAATLSTIAALALIGASVPVQANIPESPIPSSVEIDVCVAAPIDEDPGVSSYVCEALAEGVTPEELAARLVPTGFDGGTRTRISIEYRDSGFSGDRLHVFGTAGGCSSTVSYSLAEMPTINHEHNSNVFPYVHEHKWNNVVSSAQGYGGCSSVVHYDLTYFDGTSKTCSSCSTMGNMNDKTSSLKWHA